MAGSPDNAPHTPFVAGPAAAAAGYVILLVTLLSLGVLSAIVLPALETEYSLGASQTAALTIGALFLSQLAMIGVAVAMARACNSSDQLLSPRLTFRDVATGFVVGVLTVFGAGVVSLGVSVLVGLDDRSSASNTGILDDLATNDVTATLVVLAAVVGAPVAEEIFFRGFMLRAIASRAPAWVAIATSSIGFTLLHYTGGDGRETLVLFSGIGTVGVVFGLVLLRTERLAPAIVAHATFNGIAVLASVTPG